MCTYPLQNVTYEIVLTSSAVSSKSCSSFWMVLTPACLARLFWMISIPTCIACLPWMVLIPACLASSLLHGFEPSMSSTSYLDDFKSSISCSSFLNGFDPKIVSVRLLSSQVDTLPYIIFVLEDDALEN